MQLAALIVIVALALGFEVTNGFHDAASAVATSISTRALTPRAALAMAAGTYSGGWRIIRTLGRRIVALGPPEGFAAETAASSVLLVSAYFYALPVSSTQVITSAVVGVGSTRRLSAVRWGVASNIVVAWLLTLPGAGAAAALTYAIARPFVTG